ncbi:hypothetical protein M514_25929 [Trichuris suis]|uniref:Uncharacterized protein n=1 Tax=Trichuris suis TaxID=68888 RepID=A0A085MXH4_9BILA|nr:hypothetical protein M514_25929 [Trichuris suis]
MPGHQPHYRDPSVSLEGIPGPYYPQVGHGYGDLSETPPPSPPLHVPHKPKHQPHYSDPSFTLNGVLGPQPPLQGLHTSEHDPHYSSPPVRSWLKTS